MQIVILVFGHQTRKMKILTIEYRDCYNHHNTNNDRWKKSEKHPISESFFSETPCDRRFYEIIRHHRNDDRRCRECNSEASVSRFLAHIKGNSIDISESRYETENIVKNISETKMLKFALKCKSDGRNELDYEDDACEFYCWHNTEWTREWLRTDIIRIGEIFSMSFISIIGDEGDNSKEHDSGRNNERWEKSGRSEWCESSDHDDSDEHDEIRDECRHDEHISTTHIIFTLFGHARCDSRRRNESADSSWEEDSSAWTDDLRKDISDKFDSCHNNDKSPERIGIEKVHRENARSPVRRIVISESEQYISKRKTLVRKYRENNENYDCELQGIHEFFTIDLFTHFREIVFRSEDHEDDDRETRSECIQSLHRDHSGEIHHHPSILTRDTHTIQPKCWVGIWKTDKKDTEACTYNDPYSVHEEEFIEPCHECSKYSNERIRTNSSETYECIFFYTMTWHFPFNTYKCTQKTCEGKREKNMLIHTGKKYTESIRRKIKMQILCYFDISGWRVFIHTLGCYSTIILPITYIPC